jgi:hypothetical protein
MEGVALGTRSRAKSAELEEGRSGLSNLGIVAPLIGRTIQRGGPGLKVSVRPCGSKLNQTTAISRQA